MWRKVFPRKNEFSETWQFFFQNYGNSVTEYSLFIFIFHILAKFHTRKEMLIGLAFDIY
jgi:hypothetical protein